MRLLVRLRSSCGPPLPDRLRPWAGIRTLGQLGEATAAALAVPGGTQPRSRKPVRLDDAPGLRDALVAINRAGMVTWSSQAGSVTTVDGVTRSRRAAVSGFASAATVARLLTRLARTGYRLHMHRPATGTYASVPCVPVTWSGDTPVVTAGSCLSWHDIAHRLYPRLPGAAQAAYDAYQVTVYAEQCGPANLFSDLVQVLQGAQQ